jgi:hypothetical protein
MDMADGTKLTVVEKENGGELAACLSPCGYLRIKQEEGTLGIMNGRTEG